MIIYGKYTRMYIYMYIYIYIDVSLYSKGWGFLKTAMDHVLWLSAVFFAMLWVVTGVKCFSLWWVSMACEIWERELLLKFEATNFPWMRNVDWQRPVWGLWMTKEFARNVIKIGGPSHVVVNNKPRPSKSPIRAAIPLYVYIYTVYIYIHIYTSLYIHIYL